MGKHRLEVPTGWALPGPTHPRDHFALYKLLLFHSIAKEYSNFTLILQMVVLAGVEIGEIQKRVCSFTHGRREHFWRNRGLAHEPSPGDGALSWGMEATRVWGAQEVYAAPKPARVRSLCQWFDFATTHMSLTLKSTV